MIEVDWVEFLEGMTFHDGDTSDDARPDHAEPSRSYIGRLSGVEWQFAYDSYEGTLAALRNTNRTANERGTTYAENARLTLNSTYAFIRDPEAHGIERLRITYLATQHSDTHHAAALAIDISSPNFRFDGSSFTKEIALRYANALKRHGARLILFNCRYVIDNTDHVFGSLGHEHHFHITYGPPYRSDNGRSKFDCVYRQEDDPHREYSRDYKCPHFREGENMCDHIKRLRERGELDNDVNSFLRPQT